MSRYGPLTTFLEAQPAVQVRMSFSDIEQVLGRKLPPSSAMHRGWWSNNASNNVMTRAWLDAGFRSEQVDLAGRTLVFRRAKEVDMPGLNEPSMPFRVETEAGVNRLALFGWMKGTVTVAPGIDLTEPADLVAADFVDELDESAA